MGLFSIVGKAVGAIVKTGVSAVTGGAVNLGGSPKPAAPAVPFIANPTTLGTTMTTPGIGTARSDLGDGNLGRIQTSSFDVLQTLALTGAIESRYNSGGDLNAAVLARAVQDDGLDGATGALLAFSALAAVGVLVVAARR